MGDVIEFKPRNPKSCEDVPESGNSFLELLDDTHLSNLKKLFSTKTHKELMQGVKKKDTFSCIFIHILTYLKISAQREHFLDADEFEAYMVGREKEAAILREKAKNRKKGKKLTP